MRETNGISVIIPAFNAEAFLSQAIASVLGQSLSPQEILVVDDGSTDGTAAIARSFGGPVQLFQQTHLGVAAARNHGIRAAQQPYLAFLDADDLMTPDRLEVQRRMLLDHGKVDVVFGQQVYFSGRLHSPQSNTGSRALLRPALIPSALFCRASVFQRFGLLDPRLAGPEFIAWLAGAISLGILYLVAEQTVVYRRIHDSNLSRNQALHSDEYVRVAKALLDRRRAA